MRTFVISLLFLRYVGIIKSDNLSMNELIKEMERK